MKSENSNYRFRDPENTACIVCEHVFYKTSPILLVSHDKDDGCWQFLCGKSSHDVSNARVITLKQATEIDPSINDLYEMPAGIGAARETINDTWKPYAFTNEE